MGVGELNDAKAVHLLRKTPQIDRHVLDSEGVCLIERAFCDLRNIRRELPDRRVGTPIGGDAFAKRESFGGCVRHVYVGQLTVNSS
jgi:hypothetical protein